MFRVIAEGASIPACNSSFQYVTFVHTLNVPINNSCNILRLGLRSYPLKSVAGFIDGETCSVSQSEFVSGFCPLITESSCSGSSAPLTLPFTFHLISHKTFKTLLSLHSVLNNDKKEKKKSHSRVFISKFKIYEGLDVGGKKINLLGLG